MHSQLTTQFHSSLVYLDRDYIAGTYEVVSGQSPSSQITKAQSKKAGAGIPVFSAEVSAIETRSFPISTLEMLATVMKVLKQEPNLSQAEFHKGMRSQVGWLNATLGTMTAKPSKGVRGQPGFQEGDEQGCFTLHGTGVSLALVTTPDYFVSGLDTLLKMHKVLLRDLTIPVRALVRVIAAQNYMDEWIAVPYVIHEHGDA